MFSLLLAASDAAVPLTVGGVAVSAGVVRFFINNAKSVADATRFVAVDVPEEMERRKQQAFKQRQDERPIAPLPPEVLAIIERRQIKDSNTAESKRAADATPAFWKPDNRGPS